MHDHCYDLLEKKDCNVWTQYYKYRFSRGLVTCGKAGLPMQAAGRARASAGSEFSCP